MRSRKPSELEIADSQDLTQCTAPTADAPSLFFLESGLAYQQSQTDEPVRLQDLRSRSLTRRTSYHGRRSRLGVKGRVEGALQRQSGQPERQGAQQHAQRVRRRADLRRPDAGQRHLELIPDCKSLEGQRTEMTAMIGAGARSHVVSGRLRRRDAQAAARRPLHDRLEPPPQTRGRVARCSLGVTAPDGFGLDAPETQTKQA